MLHPHDYACPRCGLVLDSRTAYHRHWVKEHSAKHEEVLAGQDAIEASQADTQAWLNGQFAPKGWRR